MITVATKVDAPIKLVFQNAKGGFSMLGLGDIIVPGLLMGLALRFDLYRFYQKQTRLEPVQLTSEATSDTPGETITTITTQYRRIKAPYVDPQNQWGNRFWTTKLGRLTPIPSATSARAATAFPKPYFYASVLGYALGMAVTLTILVIFNHGQPALLYLVPGVAGSLWLTAILRGELKEFWSYTEDGSLDTEDVVVDVDANGQVIEKATTPDEKKEAEKGDGAEKSGNSKVNKVKKNEMGDVEVFLFSITAPRHRAPKLD